VDGRVLTFVGVAALLIVTPGADTAVVISQTLRSGRRAGLACTAGVFSGVAVHATASSLGLSAILARSAEAFTVVKILGAGYLLWLGARTLWDARSHHRTSEGGAGGMAVDTAVEPPRGANSLRRGFFSNVLNPKVALFFLTFLPQFLRPGAPVLPQTLLFAAIFVSMGALWLTGVVLAVGRAARALRGAKVRAAMERITGTVLVGFGVRLAVSAR
jgi:threonine/homoserine/homoserine lactone efflux protein